MPSTQVPPKTADAPEIGRLDNEPKPMNLRGRQDVGSRRPDRPAEGGSQPTDRRFGPSGFNHPVNQPPVAVIKLMVGFGRSLMTVGLLLLLFAAFQLWGTGLSEARAQAELADRFEAQLAANLEDAATVGPIDAAGQAAADSTLDTVRQKPEPLVVELPEDEPTDQAVSTSAAAEQQPRQAEVKQIKQIEPVSFGHPIGVLDIPAIGVTKTIAEGTTRDVLRAGPGHYPSTPLPGQHGNVSIAGHRTTHGAPFLDIDQLNPGDEMTIETVNGTYTYAVEAQRDGSGNDVGHLIVKPEDVGVIMNKGDNRLTLTACHPKYSARQRIIVTAVLVSSPASNARPGAPDNGDQTAPAPTDVPPPDAAPAVATPSNDDPLDSDPMSAEPFNEGPFNEGPVNNNPITADPSNESSDLAESLGWQARYAVPTLLWAAFAGLVAFGGWLFGRIWRRFPAYLMAVPPLTLCLYYCFVNLERFIPAV